MYSLGNVRGLEAFTSDLLDTEKAAIHQTAALSVEHSPLKMFWFSL